MISLWSTNEIMRLHRNSGQFTVYFTKHKDTLSLPIAIQILSDYWIGKTEDFGVLSAGEHFCRIASLKAFDMGSLIWLV